MLPLVCRCCGAAIEVRATDNPNVCQACANSQFVSWGPELEPVRFAQPRSTHRVKVSESLQEAEQFLEIEGPSVVECFDALEQAKRAIAESLAEEQAAERAHAASPEHPPASQQKQV